MAALHTWVKIRYGYDNPTLASGYTQYYVQ